MLKSKSDKALMKISTPENGFTREQVPLRIAASGVRTWETGRLKANFGVRGQSRRGHPLTAAQGDRLQVSVVHGSRR
ncbi:hypothetical protein NSU18_11230 [Paenibacillus sp. FSL H8-0048]|uniref:hypothetical protein n=2 Tax=unclassified Paenibacillus TaxID=185978 RepID=UPI0030FAC2C0